MTRAGEKCDDEGRENERPRSLGSAAPPVRAARRLNLARRIANSVRFPLNGFTYFLTLFSKFFSSFPHGTCSLSVSCPYLALDGVYHPFWAAFPNNPTLRKRIVGGRPRLGRGCHPPRRVVPSNLDGADPPRKRFSKLQFAAAGSGDFKFEPFPLHSPLLRESWLVSFPPLIDMLKFSGWSCLIRGRESVVPRVSSPRSGRGGVVSGADRPFLLRPPESPRSRRRPGRSASEGTRPRTSAATPRRRASKRAIRLMPTLGQTCSREDPRAPFAFKDSMIH